MVPEISINAVKSTNFGNFYLVSEAILSSCNPTFSKLCTQKSLGNTGHPDNSI